MNTHNNRLASAPCFRLRWMMMPVEACEYVIRYAFWLDLIFCSLFDRHNY